MDSMPKRSMLSQRQKKLLLNSDWESFITVFNEVFNSHLTLKLGTVNVVTKEKTNK